MILLIAIFQYYPIRCRHMILSMRLLEPRRAWDMTRDQKIYSLMNRDVVYKYYHGSMRSVLMLFKRLVMCAKLVCGYLCDYEIPHVCN